MNTKQIAELTTAYEQAAARCAAELEPYRRAAHDAAVTIAREAAEAMSDDVQRAALLGIIEEAADGVSDEHRAAVPLVLAQFINGHVQHHAVRAGDGRILLEIFTDGARGMNEADRRRALEAVVLAALGEVDAGLMKFPKPWHDRLTLDALRAFALILSPTTARKHAAHIAALTETHAEASRYAAALSAPVTIAPRSIADEIEQAEELIAVTNHDGNPLPLSIAGIRFPGGGAVTRITRAQLGAVEKSPIFQSGINTGSLEVMQ